MANLCSFSMKINGEKENIKTFLEWMEQKGSTYMGRGAEITSPDIDNFDDVIEEIDKNFFSIVIAGWCKWSVKRSLTLDAIDMREHPEQWNLGNKNAKDLNFITLFEACSQLNLSMEAFSEEAGNGFQEHKLFRNGTVEIDMRVPWIEAYDDITGDDISEGGFKSWDFAI